jgi:hypothetical protein
MMQHGYEKYQIILVPSSVIQIDINITHPHPFLIFDIETTCVYAMFISTKITTFYDQSRDFILTNEYDGYQTTGLKDPRCFVKNEEHMIENPHLKVLGCLSGDLLERFKEFAKRMNL